MKYYDPMFYICSEKMPFSIRIEVELKHDIDGGILDEAVNTAIKRYPYFAVRLVKKDGDITAVPNDLPVKTVSGELTYPLGSRELNYHVVALSYIGNRISFHITHVITDGAGFSPFINTVLYYYLRGTGIELSSDGIRTADEIVPDGETANPYPEEKMENATPLYVPKEKEFFRIFDGGYVTDEKRTAYSFRASEADVMRFSHENDASPCALFSAVMAKAIRDVHPNDEKDIVSSVSFNMRPGLGCGSNHRMLCTYIPVRYPKKMNDFTVRKICTCTRGSILVQSASENVLYYAKQNKAAMEEFLRLPDIGTKKAVLSEKALNDSVNNTFSVSYVGRIDYGEMQSHIKGVRNFTDGATYRTFMMEISSFNGWFYVTLLQSFSSDVYYRALLEQMKQSGIEFVEEGCCPMGIAEIEVPE